MAASIEDSNAQDSDDKSTSPWVRTAQVPCTLLLRGHGGSEPSLGQQAETMKDGAMPGKVQQHPLPWLKMDFRWFMQGFLQLAQN